MTRKLKFSDLLHEFPELQEPDVVLEKEVYAHFGLTFSAFAALEHGLVNILAQHLTSSSSEPSRQLFDENMHKCFSMTLGNIIRSLEKFYPSGEDFLDSIKQAKLERDFLAHRFFRENMLYMLSHEGLKHLLVELVKLRNTIEFLIKKTDEIEDNAVCETFGWEPEDFRKFIHQREKQLYVQAHELGLKIRSSQLKQ